MQSDPSSIPCANHVSPPTLQLQPASTNSTLFQLRTFSERLLSQHWKILLMVELTRPGSAGAARDVSQSQRAGNLVLVRQIDAAQKNILITNQSHAALVKETQLTFDTG
jgi:hypothetical protein